MAGPSSWYYLGNKVGAEPSKTGRLVIQVLIDGFRKQGALIRPVEHLLFGRVDLKPFGCTKYDLHTHFFEWPQPGQGLSSFRNRIAITIKVKLKDDSHL